MNREITATDRIVDRIGRSPLLDPIADAVQPVVAAALDSGGALAPLKNTLHGTTLDHPLHPAVTDVPVGGWTMTAVFDALDVTGVRQFRPAADLSLWVGLGGALLATASGWAEWSDTKGEPKRLGMAHALTNYAAVALYVASGVLRLAKRRGPALATAFVGYGIISFGAYLGGELGYGHGIGSKHTATPIDPPTDFTDVLASADLAQGEPRTVDLGGVKVLLSRDALGMVHGISAVCTHRGGPLGEGAFEDGCVVCPWHRSRFALADGGVVEGPAVYPLARFETRIVADRIEIRPFAG